MERFQVDSEAEDEQEDEEGWWFCPSPLVPSPLVPSPHAVNLEGNGGVGRGGGGQRAGVCVICTFGFGIFFGFRASDF
jgi:hypothetical protein